MKIIDHEPYFWFLAEENDSFFIDVQCNHSFISYSFMIELSTLELNEYRKNGHGYLNFLAEDIHNSAPILQINNSIYKGRNVSKIYAEKLQVAVEKWRKDSVQN